MTMKAVLRPLNGSGLDKLAAYQRNKEAACAKMTRCEAAGDVAGQADAEFVYRWACAGITRMTNCTLMQDAGIEGKR